MFRTPLCPSSGPREYYTSGCCLSPNTTGSNHLYNTLELLMMGIMMPETCWASNTICNKNHLLHLVGILFTHINDDARSKPHKIHENSYLGRGFVPSGRTDMKQIVALLNFVKAPKTVSETMWKEALVVIFSTTTDVWKRQRNRRPSYAEKRWPSTCHLLTYLHTYRPTSLLMYLHFCLIHSSCTTDLTKTIPLYDAISIYIILRHTQQS